MIKFKLKELLKENNMSRYKLRQYTGWTYGRVNQLYFGTVKNVKVEELDMICKIFKCSISDVIEYKQ